MMKRDALRGALETINNIPKFHFISRHPYLSEPEFEALKLRTHHMDDTISKITHDLNRIKDKIRSKATVLGIRPNYKVQSVISLETQIKEIKPTTTEMPDSYNDYLMLLNEWKARTVPLDFKLFRIIKKMKEYSQFLQEGLWYDRYKAYAETHGIAVDDENMFRQCNRHHIQQLIDSEYGQNARTTVSITIDPAVDTCIGYIHSEDPEIFTTRYWHTLTTVDNDAMTSDV